MIPTQIVDRETGEVLDLMSLADEQLDYYIVGLEESLANLRARLEAAKAEAIRRMTQRGASLVLLPGGIKWRLRQETRPSLDAARELYAQMPAEWRDRCFRLEPKPIKRELNEYAKLGTEQAQQVAMIYEVVPKLVREGGGEE